MKKAFEKAAKWYRCRLQRFLPQDCKAPILDLPCGYGNFLFFLRQVELARMLGLNAVVGDGLQYVGERPIAFEMISAIDFLEHLSKDELMSFLGDCYRALRPNGRLIVRVPCSDGPFGARDRYNDLTHEIGFTSGALSNALRAVGFPEVIVLDERPQPYKIVNMLRLVGFVAVTRTANVFLSCAGLGSPRIWTTSMWAVAQK
jgi:SAM-dependent methyltransferase